MDGEVSIGCCPDEAFRRALTEQSDAQGAEGALQQAGVWGSALLSSGAIPRTHGRQRDGAGGGRR
ncbi:hypothetical protein U9M48_028011 [Paspalum notatum var. saurae]|uniref:Uncharacterized protein n=1 Tax=Paspalum notatum var. saurae TaxID=547442 RepID=A0AAQ3TVU7_PASNO